MLPVAHRCQVVYVYRHEVVRREDRRDLPELWRSTPVGLLAAVPYGRLPWTLGSQERDPVPQLSLVEEGGECRRI